MSKMYRIVNVKNIKQNDRGRFIILNSSLVGKGCIAKHGEEQMTIEKDTKPFKKVEFQAKGPFIKVTLNYYNWVPDLTLL